MARPRRIPGLKIFGALVFLGLVAGDAVGQGNLPFQRIIISGVSQDAADAMASAASGLTNSQLRAAPVAVDGSSVTQPVSASALPLPAGAATEATLSGASAKLPAALVGGRLDVNIGARSGRTQSSAASRITSNTTTTVTGSTAYVSTIVVACSGAGTTWTLTVQNREGTPKVLVPAMTMAVPTAGPVVIQFAEPVLMTSGIDVVTAGTTAGTVDVFVTYWQ